MNHKALLLCAAAITIMVIEIGGFNEVPTIGSEWYGRRPEKGVLNSLNNAIGWLNSEPLTKEELRGKVVLVSFWTYTCINWRRTLPYLRAWAEKYKHEGLVVIGVHTPEFPFEKDVDNVREAAISMGIDYPVALDNDYAIWHAFNNQYWPALYFIDAEGHIQYQQFGEGRYDQAEKTIQQLLTRSGGPEISKELVSVNGLGAEVSADWNNLRSQENYAGYDNTVHFASPGGMVPGKTANYVFPRMLNLNEWALSGGWRAEPGFIKLEKSNGRIKYRFHSRDVHLVMGTSSPQTSVRFRVLIDGKPPGDAHGIDIDEEGNGVASQQTLYQLVRQRAPISDRQIEIEFLDPDIEIFAFTFG